MWDPTGITCLECGISRLTQSPEPYDMRRQNENLELVAILRDLVGKYPTMRLGQILCNFGYIERTFEGSSASVTDPVLEEPWDTLKRVKRALDNRSWENPGSEKWDS